MQTSQETMDIAYTVLNQIKYADPTALMAWGAVHFAAIAPSKNFQGGLEFQCSGLIHQGWVKIQLRWVDDYTITFVNRQREVVREVTQCYCDMLVSTVDWIEGR